MRLRTLFLGILLGCLATGAAHSIDGVLLKTLDYAIADKWYRTKAETGPRLSSVSSVVKKQYFFLYAAYWGMATDASGQAHVVYDITVTSPSGKVYFDQNGLEGSTGPVGNASGVHLSRSFVGICFEPEDEPGTYQIDCTVRDTVNASEKRQRQTIELQESLPSGVPMDDAQFSRMLQTYYQSPAPESTLAAAMHYANGPLFANGTSLIPVLSFFLEILDHNEFLIPLLEAEFPRQTARGQLFLVYLLRFAAKDQSAFLKQLTGDNLAAYQKLQGASLSKTDGEVSDAVQLDRQWGRFLASGTYDPVFQVAMALGSDRDSIRRAATWSLKSNCEQHELVRNYCRVIVEDERLSDGSRLELKAILEAL